MATKKKDKEEKVPKGEKVKMTLDELMGRLQKDHGAKTVGMFADTYIPETVISTGSIELDKKMDGGWQRGRLHELWGMEASGKSCLTYHAIAECQKAGGQAVFVDAEHAFKPEFAANFGVDCEKLILIKPDTGEDAFDMILDFVDTNEVALIVVDSVSALIPKAEVESEQGQQLPGIHARMMGKGVKMLVPRVAKSQVAVIFINQVREKIGVMFGNPETTTGGNALKFYCSVRLRLSAPKAEWIMDGEKRIGHTMKIEIVKNKVAGPSLSTALKILYYAGGIDQAAEVLRLGLELGLVEKAGAWYSYEGERLGCGADNAAEFLKECPEMLSRIKAKVLEGM